MDSENDSIAGLETRGCFSQCCGLPGIAKKAVRLDGSLQSVNRAEEPGSAELQEIAAALIWDGLAQTDPPNAPGARNS
jgi:hypothetical protein